jgi:Dullard-like phosphatase family protein
MFKSTIKKSNVINNLLSYQTQNKVMINKITLDTNKQTRPKTFLLDDSKKKLIPKLEEGKHLYSTKSQINFNPKYNEAIKEQKNNINDFHVIKKQKFLQKLKDMIFSPGDVNYNNNGQELKENGGTYNNFITIKNTKSTIKSSNLTKLSNSKINLLPNKTDNRKTLVLDLDETLIHSAFEPFIPRDDITLTMKMKDNDIIIHVLKRPYLDEFLNIVTQKYEVVIFTASISDYANPLLDQLDPMKKISHRLFREHCTKADNGLFIKDLNRLGRDLKNVIIIDNNPVSFIANKANGLPILTWHSIKSDNELIKLIPLLTYLSNVDDIRPIINKVVNGYYINYKEVNKIISNNDTTYNNCSSLNNNNKEDDYFNNWFTSNMKLVEKKNSFKYSNAKDKKNKMELSNDKNNINENSKMNTIQRKESFDQLIKYKGLLGSKEEFNFDNYKNSRHTKLFSGFLFNNNDNGKINNENNNGNITKKSFFMDLDEKDKKDYNKNSKNDDYDLKFNSRLDKKRNHSSKNLINIRKNINKDNDINFYNNNKLKKEKSSDKFKDISLTKYNIDNCNNSKLNKTDANINLNDSIKKNINYKNFVMNNNKNIINNNIYLINNNQSNINNENNKTIEYSNRYIFNDEVNKSFKDAYKSANSFYNKKDRSQSYEYKKRQINHNNDLSKLLDKLINYNKENKNLNINSNQLISISDNSKLLINQKIPFNQKINYLMMNNNEKSLNDKKNDLLLRINNKSKNYNYYGSYKSSSNNIYVDTGNNSENYINKNIKKSFLYEDNLKNKNINNEYNNYKLIKHKTNIENNKTIKYLSPTSNFKVNLYK